MNSVAFDANIGNDAGNAAGVTNYTKHSGTNLTGADRKAANGEIVSFAAEDSIQVWDLDAVSMGVFNKALENIAFLRAQSGGSMSN